VDGGQMKEAKETPAVAAAGAASQTAKSA